MKFDSMGNHIWSKQFHSSQSIYFASLAVSPEGNCYLTGSAIGTAVFDTIQIIFGTNGSGNTFVVKLDSSGNVAWVKYWTTTADQMSFGADVKIDSAENIYIAGFRYSVDSLNSNEHHGAFFSKLDQYGNELWQKRYKSTFNTPITCNGCFDYSIISLDDFGNVYVSGSSDYNLITIIETDTFLLPSFNFVSKFTTDGQYRYSKVYPQVKMMSHKNLPNGDLVVSGQYQDSIIIAGVTIYAKGSYDAIFLYYDSLGTCYGHTSFGSYGADYIYHFEIDSHDNLIVYGQYADTMIFNSEVFMPYDYDSSYLSDIFLLSLNKSTGLTNWHFTFGGNEYDLARDIHLDVNENLYLNGEFLSDSCNFGSFNLPNNDVCESFWGKMRMPINTSIKSLTQIINPVVFPNPVNSTLHVDFSSIENSDNLEISISNLMGEIIHSEKIVARKMEIDVKIFPVGVYIISGIVNESLFVVKFIKY
jgi:hypothetical protein